MFYLVTKLYNAFIARRSKVEDLFECFSMFGAKCCGPLHLQSGRFPSTMRHKRVVSKFLLFIYMFSMYLVSSIVRMRATLYLSYYIKPSSLFVNRDPLRASEKAHGRAAPSYPTIFQCEKLLLRYNDNVLNL